MNNRSNPDLNNLLTFIPYPEGVDEVQFADYDSEYGYNCCCQIEGGIAVPTEMAEGYQQLMNKVCEDN